MRQMTGAAVLCLGLTLAGLGVGPADAAAVGDGEPVAIGVADDGSAVAQSAPPMPESITVAAAVSPASSDVVLSSSPSGATGRAVMLPATGPASSSDPVVALLAAVLVGLGFALVRLGRQRSAIAT
jgi:hypothetical protein